MRFRKKPDYVEAFRFGHDTPPQWWHDAIAAGRVEQSNGRTSEVVTDRAVVGVEQPGWGMIAKKDDWITRDATGHLAVLDDAAMAERHESVDE